MGGPQISSAICKSANLGTYFFLDLRTYRKCGNFRICDSLILYFCDLWICDLRIWICGFAICNQIIFADFRLPQIRKNIIFVLTNISYILSFKLKYGLCVCVFRTILRQFWDMAFGSLKYTSIDKTSFKGKPMRIWIRNTAFSFIHTASHLSLYQSSKRESPPLSFTP